MWHTKRCTFSALCLSGSTPRPRDLAWLLITKTTCQSYCCHRWWLEQASFHHFIVWLYHRTHRFTVCTKS